METKTMYRLLVVTVFVLLMAVGVYIGIDVSNENEEKSNLSVSNTDNIEIYSDDIIETSSDEEIMDVTVKFSDIYPDCGHTIDTEEKYTSTTKEKVKEDIAKKDIEYKIIGEQDGVLMYQKVHVGKCLNHYKVCLENDQVIIYRISENGEYEKYQETQIVTSMLREGIVEQLNEGIEVDDIEELFLLMEDIES